MNSWQFQLSSAQRMVGQKLAVNGYQELDCSVGMRESLIQVLGIQLDTLNLRHHIPTHSCHSLIQFNKKRRLRLKELFTSLSNTKSCVVSVLNFLVVTASLL